VNFEHSQFKKSINFGTTVEIAVWSKGKMWRRGRCDEGEDVTKGKRWRRGRCDEGEDVTKRKAVICWCVMAVFVILYYVLFAKPHTVMHVWFSWLYEGQIVVWFHWTF